MRRKSSFGSGSVSNGSFGNGSFRGTPTSSFFFQERKNTKIELQGSENVFYCICDNREDFSIRKEIQPEQSTKQTVLVFCYLEKIDPRDSNSTVKINVRAYDNQTLICERDFAFNDYSAEFTAAGVFQGVILKYLAVRREDTDQSLLSGLETTIKKHLSELVFDVRKPAAAEERSTQNSPLSSPSAR